MGDAEGARSERTCQNCTVGPKIQLPEFTLKMGPITPIFVSSGGSPFSAGWPSSHDLSSQTASYTMTQFERASRFVHILLFMLLLGLSGTALSGCFLVGEAVETSVNSAASAAGEEVGEAIGQQLAPAVNLPAYGTGAWNRFMVSQAQILFGHAFSAGGMWPAQATYEPGEWVQYRATVSGESEAALDTLERAFLKETEDGNEWWRVRGFQQGNRWIYEALVDPARGEVVRLRAKDPEGNVGEVPVTENTVYRSPQRLTEESVEGATVGTENIETPAGTFSARHVEYQGGTITWYLSEEVPGHVVKYQVENQQQEAAWTSTLVAYGTDATTMLDSY